MSDDSTEVAVARSSARDRYEITIDDQQAGFMTATSKGSRECVRLTHDRDRLPVAALAT